jgi:phospholipase/carboxylesterase
LSTHGLPVADRSAIMDAMTEENAPRIVAGSLPITIETRYRLALPFDLPECGRYPCVVALHGYGEGGARFLECLLPLAAAGIAVLAPDGPYPIEIRNETPPRIGHAWYQYSGDQDQFTSALEFASEHLERLLARVLSDHPLDADKVAILGYSQGGYLAGAFGLARPERFRALVAIATRLKTELFSDEALRRVKLPVLAIHGKRDSLVAFNRQYEAIEALRRHGVHARLHAHEGGHGMRSELLEPIERFLKRAFHGTSKAFEAFD